MSSVALIIFAHSAAAPAISRHRSGWERVGKDISFVCPRGDALEDAWIIAGESCHHGFGSILRFYLALRLALAEKPADNYLFMEYDTLLLRGDAESASVEMKDGHLYGNWFNIEDPRFSTPYFPHSPWGLNRYTLRALTKSLQVDPQELGFPDRWISYQAQKACLAQAQWNGYSQNTLDTPLKIREAREAIKKGAFCIHGVKTQQQFEEVMKP